MGRCATSPAELDGLSLVLVEWADITSSHNGWMTDEDLERLHAATCYTPGWIIREDEDTLYLVSTAAFHAGEWGVGFDTVIPKGCVRRITEVRKRWSKIK
jgi:hypothetical protein